MNACLLRACSLLIALCWVTPAEAADPPAWLLGDWVLNNELTAAAQVKKKDGGGFGNLSSSVSVGGIPLPSGSGSAQQGPGGTPRDPDVLRCREMTVSAQGEDLLFEFAGAGTELMQRGNNQGRVSKWNRRKLTSRYETTSRKVQRIFEAGDDGTLIVTVKIKPKQAARITQKRIFQRPVADPAAQDPQTPQN
jgi:hypothetical protein